MPKVSVIIPCYNGERWIERALTSLSRQNEADIEIIVINDGSSDNSLDLLQKYQQTEPRLRVLNKDNGGVSSARNFGLSVATGEWITFLDIDDEIAVEGISKMLNVTASDIDIVFAGYTENGKKVLRGEERTSIISAQNLAMELFHSQDYPYLGYPWAKLYRRSIIEKNKLRFNEAIKYNEDRLFTFQFLTHIKRGIYTSTPVYNYIVHGENAMAGINGPNFWKFETDLDAFVEMGAIVKAFNNNELIRAVYHGTYQSYRWNRKLNKKFGDNNRKTNHRLKGKLYSAVPRSMIWKFEVESYKYLGKMVIRKLADRLSLS